MRKRYRLLLSLFMVEFLIIFILNKSNIKIESWIGNAIGTFIFLLPIQVLLFLLGQDKKFTSKKRMYFKIAFWFINICYFLGGVATLVLG